MRSKDYVYLPGGNPRGTFTQAAREIMERAMPYMGRYNDLYKRNSRSYKSVARGLSEDLGFKIQPQNLFFAHGAKEAMNFSAKFIDFIARNIRELFEKKGLVPPKIKLLVRAPTYQPVLSQFEGYPSFDCKIVSGFSNTDAEEYGHLHHLNLLDELRFENPIVGYGQSEFTIGYLDINPCNPSGYIRSRQETAEIAAILGLAQIANWRLLERAFGKTISFKREPFVIVEDHIYRGLEHDGNKISSFSQLRPDVMAITHTIFGVSKYGLVGMRGSVTVAPKSDIDFMQESFEEQNSDISPFSVLACEYMFGDNPKDKATRKKYLRRVTAEYERNMVIATAIIDGKAREFLAPAEHRMATHWLVKYGRLTESDAHRFLDDGIPGVDTVSLPRSGFFLMLNFDKMIHYDQDDELMDSGACIKFVKQVAHYQHAMYLGNADYMGLNKEYDAVIRFTVALTPPDLIKRLLRLRHLSETMEKIGPLNSTRLPSPQGPYLRSIQPETSLSKYSF